MGWNYIKKIWLTGHSNSEALRIDINWSKRVRNILPNRMIKWRYESEKIKNKLTNSIGCTDASVSINILYINICTKEY